MTTRTDSRVFKRLDDEVRNDKLHNTEDSLYWWSTAGRDLARMMSAAEYPEEAQRQFLDFFRRTLSPRLGARPDGMSGRSFMVWDGSPFEYSFELKGSSSTPSVRFVVDLAQLRPPDSNYPLDISNTQEVVDELAGKIPGFDDTWYQQLVKRFTHSHLESEEQKTLTAKAGHQSPVLIGFDIHRTPSSRGELPVMGKVYFVPCFAAALESKSRWQIVRSAIRQLPGIESQPNFLHGLSLIEEYLAEKPADWEDGAQYVATEFVEPARARLKVYFQMAGCKFNDIWDYYTLGGRIAELEGDKEMFRELIELITGPEPRDGSMWASKNARHKTTTLYFSLSADSPCPAPKINIYAPNFATDDESVVRILDSWLRKNSLNGGGVSMEDRMKTVFTHRQLGEETGIMTFIGMGRKESPSTKDLSIQVYVVPELYANPRD
ncbi:aromatic prenyltransferase [Xylaria sp. FL0043]|nr:aromatic prenyltransferase [Xylaria sp. FL0043]